MIVGESLRSKHAVDGEPCLARLREQLAALGPAGQDMIVVLRRVKALPREMCVPAAAVLLQQQGDITYYGQGGRFYICAGQRGFICTDCASGSVSVHATPALMSDGDLLDELLMTAIAPLLRRQGIYSLHACAVASGDRGVLFTGRSGSGKTTAGLACVRAGWRLLADDLPFIRQCSSGVEIVAHHGPVRITPATSAIFPELRSIGRPLAGASKASFCVDSVYDDGLRQTAGAALLLFPWVDRSNNTKLTRLSASMTLARLLAHSLDAWDRQAMVAQFGLLSRLAETLPAYSVALGSDVARLPDLLNSLLLPASQDIAASGQVVPSGMSA